MFFIFIYNPRSDSGTLRKRIGWDPELTIGLGNTLAVLMKGNELASAISYGESTSLSFIYRIILHSFFLPSFPQLLSALMLFMSLENSDSTFFPSEIFVPQIPTAT